VQCECLQQKHAERETLGYKNKGGRICVLKLQYDFKHMSIYSTSKVLFFAFCPCFFMRRTPLNSCSRLKKITAEDFQEYLILSERPGPDPNIFEDAGHGSTWMDSVMRCFSRS